MEKTQYLTIGEVSRMMHINIKSLRYYDRIGVLPPAYIDPVTGYRYYAPFQLGMLDAIRICIDVGIPLKQLSDYNTDGRLDTARLLEDATAHAENKINSIRQGLHLVQMLKEKIEHNERLLAARSAVEFDLPAKDYIFEPIPADISSIELNKILCRLQMNAIEHGYQPGYSFGKLYRFSTSKASAERYAYTEIQVAKDKGPELLHVPAGRFISAHLSESGIEKTTSIFPTLFEDGKSHVVFETEIVSSVYIPAKPMYELCCSVSG